MDIVVWLRGLGFEQYETTFRANDIDGSVLAQLTADDLKDLGVTSVGHRRKMLTAIAELSRHSDPSTADTIPLMQVLQAVEAERRQLTVMFCDLVGSTALSLQVNDEDFRDLMRRYHDCVAQAVAQFGGFVAKYMGDGVLVYFGYPRALEEDAELAIRAGLDAVSAVTSLMLPHALSARVGIVTGLAIVGDLLGAGAAKEYAVIGETPNLAARLQSFAQPNEIIICDRTRRQVGGLFKAVDLGLHALKGFPEPQRLWRVESATSTIDRFEALRQGETPFLGREQELAEILRIWKQARDGQGQVVLLSAEPGIGKSRLVSMVRAAIRHEAQPRRELTFFCSPHHQNSVLHPLVVYLAEQAGFDRDDSAHRRTERLRAVDFLEAVRADAFQLLAEFIGAGENTALPNSGLDPRSRKRETLEALLVQFAHLATWGPAMIVFEDVHWADPTSVELLDRLVSQVSGLPILLLITFRPEFKPVWALDTHVTALPLKKLSQQDAMALVRHLLETNCASSDSVMEEIVDRADGVPLFLEELAKAVRETKATNPTTVPDRIAAVPGQALEVPATLHASLMARLDKLGHGPRNLAQAGAAIGRVFDLEVLVAISQRSKAEINEDLDCLVASGLIIRHGAMPRPSYQFKHALVQDVAYSAMLRGRRQGLHARIAEHLQLAMPWIPEQQPEIVGRHLTLASKPVQAISWWIRAGELAMHRFACVEAASHYRAAIDLADQNAEASVDLQLRVRLQISYGLALMAGSGYASSHASEAFARARELSAGIENANERFLILFGLWAGTYVRGEQSEMQQLASDCLALTTELDDPVEASVAHRIAGATFWLRGEFQSARFHLEKAVALVEVSGENRSFRFGHSIGVSALYYLAFVLWALGEPQHARQLATRAMKLAEDLGHLPSIVYAHLHQCGFETMRRDPTRIVHSARKLQELSTTHRFPYWQAWGGLLHGWSSCHGGNQADGLAEMTQARSALAEQHVGVWTPLIAMVRSDAVAQTGDFKAAIATLNEASIIVERSGELWFESELLRLRAEYVMQISGDLSVVEALLVEAVTKACAQGARTFQLRSALVLSYVLIYTKRREEAGRYLQSALNGMQVTDELPEVEIASHLLDSLSYDF